MSLRKKENFEHLFQLFLKKNINKSHRAVFHHILWVFFCVNLADDYVWSCLGDVSTLGEVVIDGDGVGIEVTSYM